MSRGIVIKAPGIWGIVLLQGGRSYGRDCREGTKEEQGRALLWGSSLLPASYSLSHLISPDINVALRKLVCLLKPDKEIIHTGNHMTIRTITSLRNYVMDFDLGIEFEEDLGPVDGRKCQVRGLWEQINIWRATQLQPLASSLTSNWNLVGKPVPNGWVKRETSSGVPLSLQT